jgi:ribosomal protein S18 acetylase RimI-like enzyme
MLESPLILRRARIEDASALAHLTEATFTETFGHLYPPEDLAGYVSTTCTPAACAAYLEDPRMAYWVIGPEVGAPVGFALAGYCKLPVKNLEPNAGELRQLYVLSTHQNQRLGAKLFETALAWMEQQYSPLYIGVWSENYGAQRFYGRYGFSKVGEYGFPVGKTVDHEFILKRS